VAQLYGPKKRGWPRAAAPPALFEAAAARLRRGAPPWRGEAAMKPSFDGVAGAKRKIDLRGRSVAQAQSKEQLLAEARREREARAALKARTAGATAVQARLMQRRHGRCAAAHAAAADAELLAPRARRRRGAGRARVPRRALRRA
jgi:hypothetical protein